MGVHKKHGGMFQASLTERHTHCDGILHQLDRYTPWDVHAAKVNEIPGFNKEQAMRRVHHMRVLACPLAHIVQPGIQPQFLFL